MPYIVYLITCLAVIGIVFTSSCEFKDSHQSNVEYDLPYHSAVVCLKGYSYFYSFSEHEKRLDQMFIEDINGNKTPVQCNINRSNYGQ